VPPTLTVDSSRVLVVEPTFYRLRANPAVDTALVADITALTPNRIATEQRTVVERLAQQVVAVPTGGYRERYLTRWRALQQEELRDPYCEILRRPLQSEWTSTTVRSERQPK
jgi:hypothetical protein